MLRRTSRRCAVRVQIGHNLHWEVQRVCAIVPLRVTAQAVPARAPTPAVRQISHPSPKDLAGAHLWDSVLADR